MIKAAGNENKKIRKESFNSNQEFTHATFRDLKLFDIQLWQFFLTIVNQIKWVKYELSKASENIQPIYRKTLLPKCDFNTIEAYQDKVKICSFKQLIPTYMENFLTLRKL